MHGIMPKSQRMAVQLQDILGADSYQHDHVENYATAYFEDVHLDEEDVDIPRGYDLIEIEHIDSGTLVRTQV